MTDAEEQGGLVVPARPEKHIFKAPAPRTSILGKQLSTGPKHSPQQYNETYLEPADKLSSCTGLDKLAQQKREANGTASASPGRCQQRVQADAAMHLNNIHGSGGFQVSLSQQTSCIDGTM